MGITLSRRDAFLAIILALGHEATNVAEASGGGACGPVGSSQLLAAMPTPLPVPIPTGRTYPEGIGVIANQVITSGPANFGTAGSNSPSQLTVFDRHTGALIREIPVSGEDLTQEHALSELATWKNYVYSDSTQLGVLRWKFSGHGVPAQEQVSTPFFTSDQCPPALPPLPPLPNGLTVNEAGDVYVADSLQGAIWHIQPAKQLPTTPEVLFCSADLRGAGAGLGAFGVNGIAVRGDSIYVSVTFGPFGTSPIYRLSRAAPNELHLVYTYTPVEVAPGTFVPPIADGIRFDPVTHHLFVVLGGQNAVSELDLTGPQAVEVNRLTRTGPDHPFQNPSTITIQPNGTAYVSNHAILCTLPGNPDPTSPCSETATDYFGVIELCAR